MTAETVLGAADVTLKAQWEINQYTIAFDSNGGSDVASITADYGTEVTEPEDPSKTGYTFAGWTPAVPETVPASNLVCTAGWTVNQYTISFDVNGGEGEFDPATLDYGSEYGELPAPVRTGYTFLGWFDADGNEVTAETVLGDADVALAARWGINQYTVKFVVEGETYAEITDDYGAAVTAPADPDRGSMYVFTGWDMEVPETIPAENLVITAQWRLNEIDIPAVVGGDTNTTVTVTIGEPYTDAVIEQITAAAQATATRHGRVVRGWVNIDGSEVTGQTVARVGDKLTAVWETVNPLVPKTRGEGAVDNAKVVTYDAYVLDADGKAYGTVKVTVGKENRKGLSSVKAVVKPYTGGSKTFKATEAKGGKATISDTEASTVELANKGDIMTLVIGKEGVAGSGKIAGAEYEINGSLNRVKADKASYDAWKGVRTAVLADETGATVATFSFNVKTRGQVLVKGRFVNGKKTSCTAQLMVADDGSEACILDKGSKRMPFAAVVWFGANGETTVESVMTDIADGVECAAAGIVGGLQEGAYMLQTGDIAIPLVFNGKKFTSDSASVSYKASTGEFSGSFKLRYANDKRKAAALKVNFAGVFIDGIGYGMMKSGAFVTIVPDKK